MKRSVARETTWFVVLTIVLVVLVEAFSLHFISSHNQDMAKQEAQTDLNTYALALQRQTGFYRRLLEGLARRTSVHDLLELGRQEEAFRWARNYRELLSDTVGFSLINSDGEILGDPATLLIGPKCRMDIAGLDHRNGTVSPAVHRERPGLEHFDLFAPVNNSNGEWLGYVFASFRLDIIQDLLDDMIHDGQRLTVVDSRQTLVARVDRFSGKAERAFELSVPIDDMGWQITLLAQPPGMRKAYATLLIATSLLALLVGVSVVLLSRSLSRGLLQEIFNIRAALEQISEGSDRPVDIQARFRETVPLMDAVQEVSSRIQKQKETLRQLSEIDSLTGLLNRRRFSHELEKAWSLATRGATVYVMTMDIDGFKQVNDRHGHATGDRVLKAFAGCLEVCSRSTDVAARLGGDEFVMLLIYSDEDAGLELFKRLGTCFEQAQKPLPIDGDAYCTFSAGLVSIDPDIDSNAEAALRRSDEALYRAKQDGKNRLQR